eukprot:5311064-Pyramimonas_sp.AAC.1
MGIFLHRTNQTQDAWEYSHDGPIIRRKSAKRVAGAHRVALEVTSGAAVYVHARLPPLLQTIVRHPRVRARPPNLHAVPACV